MAGLILQFRARRPSSVREDDGLVVFAIPAAAVRVSDCGSSCLLWAPGEGSDRTLAHCRLALSEGGAEGFLADRMNAPLDADDAFPVRVVRIDEKYWARWGSVARSAGSRARAPRMGAQMS